MPPPKPSPSRLALRRPVASCPREPVARRLLRPDSVHAALYLRADRSPHAVVVVRLILKSFRDHFLNDCRRVPDLASFFPETLEPLSIRPGFAAPQAQRKNVFRQIYSGTHEVVHR